MTKHAGKPAKAALKIIFWTVVFILALLAAGALAVLISKWIVAISQALITFSGVLAGLWVLFAAFTLYFFRDPKPLETAIPSAIVAPAHGKVDVIDETAEPDFMGGPCQRISIFLSVFDVHVQRAPLTGKLVHFQHKEGKFMSATKSHSAQHNENLLLGFQATETPGQKIAVRLIAGMLARRILPWIKDGEDVARGERISLIQFGS